MRSNYIFHMSIFNLFTKCVNKLFLSKSPLYLLILIYIGKGQFVNADNFKTILPVTAYTFVNLHPSNVSMAEENILLQRLKATFRREAKIDVDVSSQFQIAEFSPLTVQDYDGQAERLRLFKWQMAAFDLDTPRYNLLVDPPLVQDGIEHVGGLAATICSRPGSTANALAQAHAFESPDIRHRIYRYELIQTHELAHMLGASHTRSQDYDTMNSLIQSLLLHHNRVPVFFASRSIAEMRICLQHKIKVELTPRRFCERKKGRQNKIRCYIRRGLGKAAHPSE